MEILRFTVNTQLPQNTQPMLAETRVKFTELVNLEYMVNLLQPRC